MRATPRVTVPETINMTMTEPKVDTWQLSQQQQQKDFEAKKNIDV
jgi:hypothetical protein